MPATLRLSCLLTTLSALLLTTAAASAQSYDNNGRASYSPDGATLLRLPANYPGTYETPAGCRFVAPGALAGCHELTDLVLLTDSVSPDAFTSQIDDNELIGQLLGVKHLTVATALYQRRATYQRTIRHHGDKLGGGGPETATSVETVLAITDHFPFLSTITLVGKGACRSVDDVMVVRDLPGGGAELDYVAPYARSLVLPADVVRLASVDHQAEVGLDSIAPSPLSLCDSLAYLDVAPGNRAFVAPGHQALLTANLRQLIYVVRGLNAFRLPPAVEDIVSLCDFIGVDTLRLEAAQMPLVQGRCRARRVELLDGPGDLDLQAFMRAEVNRQCVEEVVEYDAAGHELQSWRQGQRNTAEWALLVLGCSVLIGYMALMVELHCSKWRSAKPANRLLFWLIALVALPVCLALATALYLFSIP